MKVRNSSSNPRDLARIQELQAENELLRKENKRIMKELELLKGKN